MSSININSTVLPSELLKILDANEVQVGSSVSYQLCKLLWEYHPLAGKIIEKPIRLALSKSRKINIPCAIEDQLKEAFEREWERLGATNHIRDTMYLSRVYGASAIVYGSPAIPTTDPIDPWKLADLPDLYFNQLDPLNLAGSIVTNQNPNAPDFQKPNQSITAAGQPYHQSRTCTIFCGTPIYLSFQGSSFSFSGRSLFLRALYPLKSFIQTMTVDDLVSLKAGLLIAKIQQSGSIVNRLMQAGATGKRDLLKEGQTGNVLSINPDESIESIDLNNTDKAMTVARNNIIANIAAACDVPAILLKDEAYTQGFGEGTEDAKAVAQYIEGLRHDMASLYAYFDKIVQHRAWNKEFYQALSNDHPEEIGQMSYEQFFYFAHNLFKTEWPTLLEEPESEKIRRDSDKLKAMADVLKTLGAMVDPENKARVVEWFTDNINGMTGLFASPMELDIEALAEYEPPQEGGGMPDMGGGDTPDGHDHDHGGGGGGIAAKADSDWKESDHPRAKDGKFGSGGGAASEPANKSKDYGFKRTQKSQWMGTGFGKMPASHGLTVGGKETGFTISGTRSGNYYVYDPTGKKVETSSSFELAKEAAREHYENYNRKEYNRKERQPHEPKEEKPVLTVPEQLAERESDLGSIDIPQAEGSSIKPDQTRKDLGAKYKEAAKLKPKYDDQMLGIATELGVQYQIMLAPLKGVKRAVEKIVGDYKGNANKIKDLVRGTIVVDDFEQTLKAIDMISQRMGKPLGLRNGLVEGSEAESPDGYRDIKMNIEIDGHVTEVQVNFKEMIEAKDGEGHKLYEAARKIQTNANAEGRQLTENEEREVFRLFAEQKKVYNAAWDKIQARASKGGGKSTAKKADAVTAANDDEHWITLNGGEGKDGEGHGQHVLINGSGEVVGGAGGKLNGKKLEGVQSKSKDVDFKVPRPAGEQKTAATELTGDQKALASWGSNSHDGMINFWKTDPTRETPDGKNLEEMAESELQKLEEGKDTVTQYLTERDMPKEVVEQIRQEAIQKWTDLVRTSKDTKSILSMETKSPHLRDTILDDFKAAIVAGEGIDRVERQAVQMVKEMGVSEEAAKEYVNKIKEETTDSSQIRSMARKFILTPAQQKAWDMGWKLNQAIANNTYAGQSDLGKLLLELDELRTQSIEKMVKLGMDKEQAESWGDSIRDYGMPRMMESHKKWEIQQELNANQAKSRQQLIEKTHADALIDRQRVEKNKTNFVPYTPQKTVADAARFVVQSNYAAAANFGKMNIDVVNAQIESLSFHLQKFPELAAEQRNMGSIQVRAKDIVKAGKSSEKEWAKLAVKKIQPNLTEEQLEKEVEAFLNRRHKLEKTSGKTWAYSVGDAHTYDTQRDWKGVFFNEKYAADTELFQKTLDVSLAIKWHPVGCDTIKSVADHEYGHQMDNLLKLVDKTGVGTRGFTDPRMQKIWEDASKDGKAGMKELVSEYAAENKMEFIAECWAEYLNNPQPRSTALAMGWLIEDIYAEKFGKK